MAITVKNCRSIYSIMFLFSFYFGKKHLIIHRFASIKNTDNAWRTKNCCSCTFMSFSSYGIYNWQRPESQRRKLKKGERDCRILSMHSIVFRSDGLLSEDAQGSEIIETGQPLDPFLWMCYRDLRKKLQVTDNFGFCQIWPSCRTGGHNPVLSRSPSCGPLPWLSICQQGYPD